ncbi:uncharacterized protein [Palaemon carinicauda]|uniref:uncharacterized protein n=1 Tax=Palaemon carinicauda TaxID=392227 RepID=UPI0035B63137
MTIKTVRILLLIVLSGVALLAFQFLQWRFYNLPDINSDDPKLSPVQMPYIGESRPAPIDKYRPVRTSVVKGRSLEASRNVNLPIPGMKLDLGIAPRAMAEPKVKGLPQPALMGHKILDLKKRDTSEQLSVRPLRISRHPGQVKKTDPDPRRQVKKTDADSGKHMNGNNIKRTVKIKTHVKNVHNLVHKQMASDSPLKDKKLSDQMYPNKIVKGKELRVPKNRTRLAAEGQYANQNDLVLRKLNDSKKSSHVSQSGSYIDSRKKGIKRKRPGKVHRTKTYKKPLVIVAGSTELSEMDRKRLKA